MIDDKQVYIVVDIEADGPAPGLHSMLSIGAIATTPIEEVGSFYRKLEPIKGASQYAPTMEWWRTQPEAWSEVTKDALPAAVAIKEFCDWLEGLGREPVFVAHPVAFDYAMVSWYLWKFAENNPFTDQRRSPRALDLASFIAGKFDLKISETTRQKMPSQLTGGMPPHSHNALDDARGYGVILRNALAK